MLKYDTNKIPLQRKTIVRNAGMHLEDNRPLAVQRKAAGPAEHCNSVTPLKAADSGSVVQLEKKKQVKYTVGGGVGLGLVGAGIGSVVPGVGTLTGGLVGLVVGGLSGYLYSKPKVYHNLQSHDYENELKTLRVHQKEFKRSKSAYEKGTIIKYSGSAVNQFLALLSEGNVLYTYDVNNQLSIGSGVGPMKHALVAGNENVKAAGWAKPQASKAQSNEQMYQYYLGKLRFFQKSKQETEAKALHILKKRNVKLNDYGNLTNESEKEIVGRYKVAIEHLASYTPLFEQLKKEERQKPGVTKASRIQLDNESGHYHPGTDTKDEAFEGWRNAGFNNLAWKPWGKK